MSSQTAVPVSRSSTAITTTAVTVAEHNVGRQYLFIQNLSDVVMYVRVDDGVAVAGTPPAIYLAANGGYSEWQGETWVPAGAISIIAASGSGKAVTVLEG